MRIRRLLCLCAAVCALCACMNAGPSTEEGNPQIIATVVDSGNRPVAGAIVVAYLMPANSDSGAQPLSARSAAFAQTNSDGSCLFEGLDPGNYSVVATDSAGNRSAMRSGITITVKVPDAPEFSDTLVLAASGSLRGIVTRNGVQGVTNQNLKDGGIQIKIGEIDRSSLTGPDGAYSFSDLPPGAYTLYFYAYEFYSAKRENLVVAEGDPTLVDTVILTPWSRLLLVPPKGLRAVYDTAAQIVNLSWQPVHYDSLRWYKVQRINLSSLRETDFICLDTVFTDTITGISAGTILDYAVCSVGMVDGKLSQSASTAPIEINVAP
jgi:uncharacterized protein (DUF2141 family)